jgi:hypothetical protein
MKNAIFRHVEPTYDFAGLLRPIRRKAINDNHIPMLSVIIKHTVLMSGAFIMLYLLHSLI